ncbi:MAG: hypothetical protein K0R61_120 [Microvirga sp.]|jgi:hypothetical protein|nr:hypothetical protein [Microvirga sp.]
MVLALSKRVPNGAPLSTAQHDTNFDNIELEVNAKAPLASPTFTGNPTAPTPSFTDDDTSVATTAFVQDVVTQAAPNDKTANFTFALADASTSKITRSNSASSVTGTVPPNGTVAFPVNQTINLVRYGTGAFVIAAGTGVTIQKASDRALSIRVQYSGATLWKVATDTWVLMGDLT